MAAEAELASGAALSQMERVADTLVAPTKTFEDVRRSGSWWLPFVLIALTGYLLAAAIQMKVGWPQLVENEIHANSKLSERLAGAPPEQATAQRHGMLYSFQGTFYALPLFNLGIVALAALVLWGTINFGFGGSATYGRVFCVGMYAALPGAISALLSAAMLFAGRSPDTFTTQTMLGSNLGYYIDTAGPLKTFLTSIDLFQIWTAVLMSIGLAIVAHTKRSAGYAAVFGWYILIALVKTAVAAVNT